MTDPTGGPRITLNGGVAMPMLGLGTWQAEGQQCYDAVSYALQVGYRHIDTATGYGNEREVGRAFADSRISRDEVFITTKMPPEKAGREEQTLRESLDKLGTDYVDLWLVHWPPSGRARPDTWQRFRELRDQGLARAIGVSNYSTAQLDELIGATGEAPAVNQIKWGPSLHDPARLRQHEQRSIAVEGYSPLNVTNLEDRTLQEVATTHGVTPAQVVLRWHLEHKITVIPKSVTRQRIEKNYDLFSFILSDREVAALDALSALPGRPPLRSG